MEAIGTLAGGIAHEFNNILSIIIGNNELIMEDLPQWSLSRDSCEEIRLAGIRARDIVRHLLTFSRQDDSTKTHFDMGEVVRESLKLIRATTPQNIEIRDNISTESYPVRGDATQINQILINLCNNAVHALPISDGRIEISLGNTEVDPEREIVDAPMKAGKYVRLTVRDNGSGMEKAILDRIFEPYFTTKDIGEGSGIGLAVVHGIVENHNGSITCDSRVDKGTTFTIMIPAHDGPAEAEPGASEMRPGKGERILYVDDEPAIARLGRRHLTSLGYEAFSTTSPSEALELIKADPGRFDLVISDMAMPEMPGDQLVAEIFAVNPKIPAIICTGYSSRMSESKAVEMGVGAFLMKPLNKSELAEKIRQVLDTSG
jgi:CheY-like chemotaxis protein